MKVVIEKEEEEASIIQFDAERDYIVLKNFVNSDVLGSAKVSLNGGVLYAELKLNKNVKGYPSVGFTKNLNTGSILLYCVAICDNKNTDETIELIEYKIK